MIDEARNKRIWGHINALRKEVMDSQHDYTLQRLAYTMTDELMLDEELPTKEHKGPRCIRCGATKEYVVTHRGTDLASCLPGEGSHIWSKLPRGDDTAHHAWHSNGQHPETCGPCASFARLEKNVETHKTTLTTFMQREQDLALSLPTACDLLAQLIRILVGDTSGDDSVGGLGVTCLARGCDDPVIYDLYCDAHLPPRIRALWPDRNRIDISPIAARKMHEGSPSMLSNNGACAAVWCIIHHPEKTDPALDVDAAKRHHDKHGDMDSHICLLNKCAQHYPAGVKKNERYMARRT